jgi:hypothetical protein
MSTNGLFDLGKDKRFISKVLGDCFEGKPRCIRLSL